MSSSDGATSTGKPLDVFDGKANKTLISSESNDPQTTQNDIQQNPVNDNSSLRQWPPHLIKKIIVIWLEPNISEKEIDYRNLMIRERNIANAIEIFTDVDQCIDFLIEFETAKLFFILSDTVGKTVLPLVHEAPQLDSIYIFSDSKTKHEQWAIEWRKIKGIFTDISSICDQLEWNIKQHEQDLMLPNIVSASSALVLNELDQSFMYSQLLKETLLEMNDNEEAQQKFFQFYRTQFKDNVSLLNRIDQFEQDYHHHSPIWWYNKEPSISSMLNKALGTQDIASIIKMGSYVRALHQEIERVHAATNQIEELIVYRGKVMSQINFEKIRKNQGHLISFNSFVSATITSQVAWCYADIARDNLQLTGVVFQMKIDPSISATPYALLDDVNKFGSSEKELLFSMHAVFRIGDIDKVTDNLWTVVLTLTSETDQELYQLTERIREEIGGSSGLHRLGNLLIKMGEFDKAESVFKTLLESTSHNDLERNIVFYAQMGNILRKKGDFPNAITYFHKALEIQFKTSPSNHIDLANIYNNIGRVHSSMGVFSTALSYYEKALEIRQNSLPLNHPDLAITYKNIGDVYHLMGNYPTALSYYEKTLEIQQKSLPPNHPQLAITYNNVGQVCDSMGDYPSALSYYEKTVQIQQRSLPPNHPDLAITYKNIGEVQNSMGDYSAALSYYERALEIQQKSLPSDHPDLATTYKKIGKVYHFMGNHITALAYYERTLEIQQKSLPPNHPDLATTYNSIGRVHDSMDKYLIALSHYEKALEIQRKSLPSHHPDLADTYNNIGRVHVAMEDYVKAGTFYKKTLKIQQIALSSNHPSLAITYNNIGRAHELREHYSDALFHYKEALKIQQKALPPDHPSLAITYSSIGEMYRSTGDCSSALSYHEKALEKQTKCLSACHPLLAETHYHTAMVLEGLHRYKEAVEHALRAVNIARHNFEPNQSKVEKYQQYLDQILLVPECSELVKTKDIHEWTYPLLLILHSSHQSRLHSILYDLTDGHLMPPSLAQECFTTLQSSKQVKSIIFEILNDSIDERDRLLKDFSSIDHIESIYLLGKPPETRELQHAFFTSFCKVSMFCDDEEQLAVRWALDTANEFRRLGGQCADAGNIDLAREHFQRGEELYDGLAKLIDKTRPKMS